MDNRTHLLKLCVGAESVEDLARWQKLHAPGLPGGLPRHVTRMWPKRVDDLLNGGSLYWIIKGAILCRQQVIRLDEVDRGDGIRRCGIVLDPEIVLTTAAPRRPFQGWRYLAPADAPADLRPGSENDDELPAEMRTELARLGIL